MEHEPIRTQIVKIGNSQGIRIPKALLALSGIQDAVELVVHEGTIIIRPTTTARLGWDEAFRAMAAAGDDQLLDEQSSTEWDKEDWQW